MIFGVWYVLWIVVASSGLAFLIPYCAVAVRGSYVKQRVELLRSVHLFLLAVIFLFLAVGGEDLYYASLTSLRVGAFMALMVHYSGRRDVVSLGRLPRFFASTAFVGERYFRVVTQRREDFEFSVRMRCELGEGGAWRRFTRKLGFTVAAIVSVTTDLVRLANQVSTILQARGGFPHPRRWQIEARRRWRGMCLAVGDLLLLALLLGPLVGGVEELFPDQVKSVVLELRSLAGGLDVGLPTN